MRENDIQNAICDYLALRKYCFWRQNTVGVYDAQRKAFRSLPKYAITGTADIILIDGGLAVFLEVKTKTGRQSPSQKEFEKKVTDAGAQYFIVRSVDDVQALGF